MHEEQKHLQERKEYEAQQRAGTGVGLESLVGATLPRAPAAFSALHTLPSLPPALPARSGPPCLGNFKAFHLLFRAFDLDPGKVCTPPYLLLLSLAFLSVATRSRPLGILKAALFTQLTLPLHLFERIRILIEPMPSGQTVKSQMMEQFWVLTHLMCERIS